jgi:hypothetical protein
VRRRMMKKILMIIIRPAQGIIRVERRARREGKLQLKGLAIMLRLLVMMIYSENNKHRISRKLMWIKK